VKLNVPDVPRETFMDIALDWLEYAKYHKCEFYKPYPFQKLFHRCPPGKHIRPFEGEGTVAPVRGLISGNKVGKTICAAYEVSYHLTGLYPDWWEGIRFDYPVEWLIAGVNNDKTRDICQKELFGEPTGDALGTGTVPKEHILDTNRKPGIMNAYDNVLVRHSSGGVSKAMFQAYEQKKAAFMGVPVDGGWMDEEPPEYVFNQFVRGTIAKAKYTLLLTFTPENGSTDLVFKWLHELQKNQGLVCAGWRDAPHIWDVPGKVDELRSLFPKWEWEMREEGRPVMGTGRVFRVPEEEITTIPIELPSHWPRICGIDYGMEHPFTAVWIAHDTDNDIIYVYDCFRKPDLTIAEMSSVLKRHGDWIPVVWPHDMAKRAPGVPETKSGQTIQQLFADEGVKMLESCFTNPPSENEKEGSGGNSVSAGILKITERMQMGRCKVFSSLPDFFEEFRNYHTENGVIVKKRDDIMDAFRYAAQSVRWAEVKTSPVTFNYQESASGWMGG